MTRKNKNKNIIIENEFEEVLPVEVMGPKPIIQARSYNQQLLIESINTNTITFAEGPAGCGKTAISVAMAINALKRGQVKKIILTRPLVQAGEDMGFLPGSQAEKLLPYLLPLYDEFVNFASKHELDLWLKNGAIEICPLAHMRGRNFHHCFIIGDEMENATFDQMKMFVTRIGKESTAVITGDTDQTDLVKQKSGALAFYIDNMENIDGIGIIRLDKTDIVRNPIISRILDRLEERFKRA